MVPEQPRVRTATAVRTSARQRGGPRGATLAEGFDPEFERRTDAHGRCSYAPREGNLVLVVTHLVRPEERGEVLEKTSYAATLVLDVPQRCACCE